MTDKRIPETLLAKVRALLAQAEDDGVTPAEAEAFTAKASELMAKYGIEQALLADREPNTDQIANRVIAVTNPWKREKQGLVAQLVNAMRGRAVLLDSGQVHLFGYESDLRRAELLYTSLLLQMARQLTHVHVPYGESPRAYRRSWLLGFRAEVVRRVKAAEASATAEQPQERTGRSTELVLADRTALVEAQMREEYPHLRKARVTFTGSGYGAGRVAGARANIGQRGVGGGRRAIGGGR